MIHKHTHYSNAGLLVLTAITGFILGVALLYFAANRCPFLGLQPTLLAQPQQEQSALNASMRALWGDHVIWTRNYIVAALNGTKDVQPIAQRLLQNQDDIGNAMIPYFGEEVGKKLTDLLKEHIAIGVEVINAAKANNKEQLEAADKKWHQNADELAKFLSSTKLWSEKDLQKMLYDHLKLTTQQVVARLNKDWQKDVDTFDQIFLQAMHMADTFTEGILRKK